VGPALGLDAGPWPVSTVALEEGATLLFYSDGLVETRAQDLQTGIDVLRDLVEQLPPRRRNPRELCARIGGVLRGVDTDDDVTLVAVAPSSPQPTASRDLPSDASAAGLARRFVTSALGDWDIDENVVDTAQLLVSELVTNAVIHSATPSTVTVRTDGEYLLVLVQDGGGSGPVQKPPELEPEAISGRGLSLVEALTSAWSFEQSADRTTVWFELPLDPVDSAAGAEVMDSLVSSPGGTTG
jgi:anti-sigma regulatory factor (Ser/Thr protein kinase)